MKHTKETVKDLAVAIDTLPGKVIGWNEERGVYNLEIVSSGGYQ